MAARSDDPSIAGCRADEGKLLLLSPGVGLWRDAPPAGALIAPGDRLGRLEVLGVLRPVVAPAGAHGIVLPAARPALARRPVGYGELLLALDPSLATRGRSDPVSPTTSGAATASGGRRFCSPASGRVYLRPAPDKEPFVTPGALVRAGQTVCLLEVMKTFTRIHYGGAGLPAQARVVRVVPRDQDDLAAGEVILELDVGA